MKWLISCVCTCALQEGIVTKLCDIFDNSKRIYVWFLQLSLCNSKPVGKEIALHIYIINKEISILLPNFIINAYQLHVYRPEMARVQRSIRKVYGAYSLLYGYTVNVSNLSIQTFQLLLHTKNYIFYLYCNIYTCIKNAFTNFSSKLWYSFDHYICLLLNLNLNFCGVYWLIYIFSFNTIHDKYKIVELIKHFMHIHHSRFSQFLIIDYGFYLHRVWNKCILHVQRTKRWLMQNILKYQYPAGYFI